MSGTQTVERKITRRTLTLGGAMGGIGLAGAALAACGTVGPGTSGSQAPKSRAPFTLELLVSFNVENEPWFKETFLPQYKAKAEHVTVNYTWVDWTKMEDHFGVHKVAGTLQDVIRTGAGPWVWI